MGCRSSEKREGLTHCTQEGPNVTKSAYLLWIEKNRKANNSCWQIGGSRLFVFAKFLGSRSFNGFARRPSAPTDDAWSTGFQIIEWSLYGTCPVILTQPQRLASFLRNCKIEIPATLSPYPQIFDNMLAVIPVELVRTWERAIQILTSGETGPSTELVQVGHRCWMIS
jgi:hypothetical protein